MQMPVFYPTSKICFVLSFFESSEKHIIWGFFGRESYMEFIVSISAECILQKLPCGPQHSNSEDSKLCPRTSRYGCTFPDKLNVWN